MLFQIYFSNSEEENIQPVWQYFPITTDRLNLSYQNKFTAIFKL